MNVRPFLCLLLLALAWPGCAKDQDAKKKSEREKAKAEKPEKPEKPLIPDASTDVSFQSFIGRLRAAVARKDRATIQQMMAPDFGWRWDQGAPGETAFDYWDKQGLWGELVRVLQSRFTPYQEFMVGPPEFAEAPHSFTGYRAGMKMLGGSWRFTYFVPPPEGTGEELLQ